MRLRSLAPVLGLSAALVIPAGVAVASGSHGPVGHDDGHKGWSFGAGGRAPLGSVSALSSTALSVLGFDGTTTNYALDANTKYFLDGAAVTPSAALIGDQVVVDLPRERSSKGAALSPTAQVVFFISAHVVGTVQSVTATANGQSIVVADPQGFWHTISTTSTTGWYVSGVSAATAPSVTAGLVISSLGVVDADHTTLDATQVNVNPKKPTPPKHGTQGGHH